jgi:PKD repeat protein
MDLEARVANYGLTDLTDVIVTANVYQGASLVQTTMSSPGSIVVDDTISLYAGGTYTPPAAGTYSFEYIVSSVSITDGTPSNDTFTYDFVVDGAIYARDNANVVVNLGVGAGATAKIGNMFEVNAATRMDSVIVAQSGLVEGDSIYLEVYDVVAGLPGSVIGMTDYYIVTAADETAGIVVPKLAITDLTSGGLSLAPGMYVVAANEFSSSASMGLACTDGIFTEGTVFSSINGGAWGTLEDLGFSNSAIIRPTFTDDCTDPVAAWTNVPTDLVVAFTDGSTSGTGTSWAWDFGDGNTSTMQNPSHTYATAGTYTVCLTVTDDCSSNQICNSVTVSGCSDPVAAWTNVPTDLTVAFTDGSTVGTGESWAWDFGDGNTSTMQNPSHTYAAAGTYTVCLDVTDDCGTNQFCNDVTVSVVGINENSFNAFSVYPVPANDVLNINDINVDGTFEVAVINQLGQVLINNTYSNNKLIQLDVNGLVSGFYQVRVTAGNQVGMKQFLISK